MSCCFSSCYCGVSFLALGPVWLPPPFPGSSSCLLRVSGLEESLIPCMNPTNPNPAGWKCSRCLHTSLDRELTSLRRLPDLNPTLTACSIYQLLMVQRSGVPDHSQSAFSSLDIPQMVASGSPVLSSSHPQSLLPSGKFL